MIKQAVDVSASELRFILGELTQPNPEVVYVVRRHGRPLMLIWPARDLTDEGAMRTRIAQVVKSLNVANHAVGRRGDTPIPEHPRRVSQTELRRTATAFYLQISSTGLPGLITHYGQDAAVYVPVGADNTVEQWVKSMNTLLN